MPRLGGALPVAKRFIEMCRPMRHRSMLRFACEEIPIVDGPYADEQIMFTPALQPAGAAALVALGDSRYYQKMLTGPNQFGKTLIGFATPTLYELFERRQNVICGVAEMEMASDKWQLDLLPVIEKSRYRDFLPTRGGGSKGGTPTRIDFSNGTSLRFMTSGGGDKSRSAYTAPVLVVTELEAFDVIGHKSREGSKLAQLERRTLAYQAIGRRRHYYECTIGSENGATHEHVLMGTNSRLAVPCPHCRQHVVPEREHLVGWDAANNMYEAGELAVLVCPACGEGWTEAERRAAVEHCVLVHEGQSVGEGGEVVGTPKRTDTLSLRISCVHNYFTTMEYVAREEWRARFAGDESDERVVLQSYWAMPQKSRDGDATLTATTVALRCNSLPRRICPADTQYLTLGADLRTQQVHWVVLACTETFAAVVDYGVRNVTEYRRLGVEEALKQTLHQLRQELFEEDGVDGFTDVDGNPVQITGQHGAGLDTSAWTAAMYDWVREAGPPWTAVQGLSVYRTQSPRDRGRIQGFEAYWSRQPCGTNVLQINTDYYKRLIQDAFAICRRGEGGDDLGPFDEHGVQLPGSLTLFGDEPRVHRDADTDRFADQMVAEAWSEERSQRPGVSAWQRIGGRPNHYFDAVVYALAIAAQQGWRPAGRQQDTPTLRTAKSLADYMNKGGRPWRN